MLLLRLWRRNREWQRRNGCRRSREELRRSLLRSLRRQLLRGGARVLRLRRRRNELDVVVLHLIAERRVGRRGCLLRRRDAALKTLLARAGHTTHGARRRKR
jgi:hypothetical protein